MAYTVDQLRAEVADILGSGVSLKGFTSGQPTESSDQILEAINWGADYICLFMGFAYAELEIDVASDGTLVLPDGVTTIVRIMEAP